MTRLARTLLVAALASLVVGCGSSTSDDDGAGDGNVSQDDLSLDGRDFISTDITVSNEPYQLASDTVIGLAFADGRITGQAGCNTMSGKASYGDGTLVISDGLATTEMGCDPDLMTQDEWLADLLSSKPTLSLDGDTLTLTGGDTVVALLDSSVARPDVALTQTTWTLDSIGTSGEDGSVSSVPQGVISTMTISDDGELALQPGCNTGGASVTVTDSTLEIGPVRLTKMMCEGAANEVERSVLAVLDGTVDYSIKSDVLTLTNGANTLTYRASQ